MSMALSTLQVCCRSNELRTYTQLARVLYFLAKISNISGLWLVHPFDASKLQFRPMLPRAKHHAPNVTRHILPQPKLEFPPSTPLTKHHSSFASIGCCSYFSFGMAYCVSQRFHELAEVRHAALRVSSNCLRFRSRTQQFSVQST